MISRALALADELDTMTTFGRIRVAEWWRHFHETGEHLHVYLDGEDVTLRCREADDATGCAEIKHEDAWAWVTGRVEISPAEPLFEEGSLSAPPPLKIPAPRTYEPGQLTPNMRLEWVDSQAQALPSTHQFITHMSTGQSFTGQSFMTTMTTG